ncbi:hypothetical protein [Gimesia panareensis]|uniref:hypothetical protein n=1 Tax=Gimesia panareensis TaxID=2527978 RepID=UPI00118849CC|nr:hypothetical protein [Gimesia panareensis]QDU51000.1 hypothetical protein Pan110_33610 [Gimesia panareensis]
MYQQRALKSLVIVSTVIVLAICTIDRVPAQKKEDTPAKASAKETKATPAKRKVRLPNHYGKLNLSDTQRDKIYKIQTDYKSQIDSLKKQLAELNAKKDAECAEVLTTSQKSILGEILTQIEKKKAAKKKQ